MALKKKYVEYREKQRRIAAGEPEEAEDDALIGGMAKAGGCVRVKSSCDP
jgi:hypothetical protein